MVSEIAYRQQTDGRHLNSKVTQRRLMDIYNRVKKKSKTLLSENKLSNLGSSKRTDSQV